MVASILMSLLGISGGAEIVGAIVICAGAGGPKGLRVEKDESAKRTI